MGRALVIGLLFAAAFISLSAHARTLPEHEPIAVDAKPNGIAVRAADGALFITDDRSNSVLMRAADTPFTPYASIPAIPNQPNSLSQLAFTDSGGLLLQRFGFGSTGALFEISGPGQGVQLPGPAPARRRLGLAPLDGGRVLSTWFIKDGDQPVHGGLSLITYDAAAHTATERDLLTELGKPVGVAIAGDAVFVADQTGNAIFRLSLAQLLSATHPSQPGAKFAQVTNPDMMAADTNGTLYTKCNTGDLCSIAPDGGVTVAASGFHDARGVAIDIRRRRLYAVDRAAPKPDGAGHIRVLSLE